LLNSAAETASVAAISDGLVAGTITSGAEAAAVQSAVYSSFMFAPGSLATTAASSGITSMASTASTAALSGHDLSVKELMIAGVTAAVSSGISDEVGSWGTGLTSDGTRSIADWGMRAASVATRAGASAALNELRGANAGQSFSN